MKPQKKKEEKSKIGYIGREKPLFLAQLFSIKKLQAKAFNMQKKNRVFILTPQFQFLQSFIYIAT